MAISEITGAGAKGIRLGKKFGQRDFWKAVGVSQSVGSRYEAGVRVPKSVQLLIASVYLGAPKPTESPRSKSIARANLALRLAKEHIDQAISSIREI